MIEPLLFFVAALLYSSVGHAGASGYLAVMALTGAVPEVMRPTALTLNLVVASLGTANFVRAGHFRWPIAWPFLVTSVPMAWVGGRLSLPVDAYRSVIGLILLISAVRFVWTLRSDDHRGTQPSKAVAMLVGALLGLLAGLTGVGGGIFLSPLLLFLGWADLRTTAATSVVFILANSAAGLAGQLSTLVVLPPDLLYWAIAVAVGGLIGSWLGARRLPTPAIRAVLAIVLTVAGLKLL